MIIVRKREYSTALKVILSFISKDSRNRAIKSYIKLFNEFATIAIAQFDAKIRFSLMSQKAHVTTLSKS